MNILTIGNSFSQDATHYLHAIARKEGKRVDVCNLYLGGCSLERHYRLMLADTRTHILEFNGHSTGFTVSMKEALCSRAWDVVTLQQVSTESFKSESFFPYITELANYVRRFSPKARIMLHETWSYEDGSENLYSLGFEHSEEMLAGIMKTYREVAPEIGADAIIPSGEVIGRLERGGMGELYRDHCHLSFDRGRYASGMLLAGMLAGCDPVTNKFTDTDNEIPEADRRVIASTVASFLR